MSETEHLRDPAPVGRSLWHRAFRSWPLAWLLLGSGLAGAAASGVLDFGDARSAASQDWPPFVLVAGLLLIGLVADEDHLFSAAGHVLAGLARDGRVLFAGAVILIGVVTAVLNLDTSVAFLTPVLIYTARQRGGGEAPLLYGCLMLSNAGSLLLPGSNLTNLIVLGHLHLSGGAFLTKMGLPWMAAVVVTAGVVAIAERHSLASSDAERVVPDRPQFGLGIAALTAAVVLMLVLRAPALPIALVGGLAAIARVIRHRDKPARVFEVLGLPTLLGLFGLAVTLGAIGRAWSGPSHLLAQLDTWSTAAVAAVTSVLVNNLPAASLLAARVPHHPYALLIGLNLGPNLFVTGSLSWILWIQAARIAGVEPSIRRASRIGIVAVPFSIVAALSALALSGLH